MKSRNSFYAVLVVAAIGIILAFVYLFPSRNPPETGGFAHAPATPVASAPLMPVMPAPGASATMILPIPPPNAIPAPVAVMPPPKPQAQLDDAIRLPGADRPLNQTPPLPPTPPASEEK